MAYRKLRIISTQSDPITADQNLLDFRIPSNLKVEADKSYISLFCKMATTDDQPAAADGTGSANSQQYGGGNGVYNLDVACDVGGGSFVSAPSVSFVKNAHLISSNKGNVEHLRDVNKLRMSLHSLENSYQEDNDTAHIESGRLNDKAWGLVSPFIQTGHPDYGLGASYLEKELRIPLKSIFNICKGSLDTGYLGACDLHLEMDASRINAIDSFNTEVAVFTGANGYGEVDDNTTLGDVSSITLSKEYARIGRREELPFYIGMKILFTAGNIELAGGVQSLVNFERIITQISHVNNKVILGLNLTLGTSVGAGLTGVKVRPLDPPAGGTTLNINRAELILRTNDSLPNENGYEYTTYTLEKDQGGGATSFSKQYECEPESINLLVHTPETAGGLLSNLRQDKQRVSINNKETTNRDVNRHTPLYNSQLNRYALNSGIMVKSLAQTKNKIDYDSATPSLHDNPNSEMWIYEPLPQTPDLKLVNIEMTMDAARPLRDVNIFKEVVRTI